MKMPVFARHPRLWIGLLLLAGGVLAWTTWPKALPVTNATARAPGVEQSSSTQPGSTPADPVRAEAAAVVVPAGDEDLQLRAKADEGARLFAARRFAEAAVLLLPAAEAGYPQAQFQMGWMHYLGFGVGRDLGQAVAWFERAAQLGSADGMNALGTALREGKGAEQNHAEALRWYAAAANQGHADGEVNLGFMHEMGYGSAKDPAAAASWYQLAAAKNHATAQLYLATLYEDGKGLPRDVETARGWYRRSAAQGNEYARLALQRLEGAVPPTTANPAASWAGER